MADEQDLTAKNAEFERRFEIQKRLLGTASSYYEEKFLAAIEFIEQEWRAGNAAAGAFLVKIMESE